MNKKDKLLQLLFYTSTLCITLTVFLLVILPEESFTIGDKIYWLLMIIPGAALIPFLVGFLIEIFRKYQEHEKQELNCPNCKTKIKNKDIIGLNPHMCKKCKCVFIVHDKYVKIPSTKKGINRIDVKFKVGKK